MPGLKVLATLTVFSAALTVYRFMETPNPFGDKHFLASLGATVLFAVSLAYVYRILALEHLVGIKRKSKKKVKKK